MPVSGNLLHGKWYPIPLVFWNDGVTAGLPLKPWRNKDLIGKIFWNKGVTVL
jgi:hypothetical protein